jgi:hypothetical protein
LPQIIGNQASWSGMRRFSTSPIVLKTALISLLVFAGAHGMAAGESSPRVYTPAQLPHRLQSESSGAPVVMRPAQQTAPLVAKKKRVGFLGLGALFHPAQRSTEVQTSRRPLAGLANLSVVSRPQSARLTTGSSNLQRKRAGGRDR